MEADGICLGCAALDSERNDVLCAIRECTDGVGILLGKHDGLLLRAYLVLELRDDAGLLVNRRKVDLMAWSDAEKPVHFISETPGDYVLAKAVGVIEKENGKECLVLESYDPARQVPQKDKDDEPILKDGKPVMGPKSIEVRIHDPGIVKLYKERKSLRAGGDKGQRSAHKYTIITISEPDDGRCWPRAKFTDKAADMTRLKDERGGTYMMFHPKPMEEREEKPKPAKGRAAEPVEDVEGDEDLPF